MKCPKCGRRLVNAGSPLSTTLYCRDCWLAWDIEWLVRFYHTLAASRRALTMAETELSDSVCVPCLEVEPGATRAILCPADCATNRAFAAIKGARTAMRRAEKGESQ